MKHVIVLGLKLEYMDFPAAIPGRPVLLLLHEGLGCVALWRDFPEKLAAATGCRVLVYSRAGYGGSQPYQTPRDVRYLHREALEALPAFMTALGIEHPILLGHSDGGSIALIHAGAYPEVPLAVVVMAPHEFIEAQTLSGICEARKAWLTTDLPLKLARYHFEQTERVFLDWSDCWLSAEFLDWNIMDYLPKIRCPVLAIQGEQDEYASMRQIEVIAEQVPGARLLKLDNCGHSPQRDQQAKVIAAVQDLLINNENT